MTDHHAVIPTRNLQNADLSGLPVGERMILELVAEAEALFQTQGVARAETDVFQPELRAGLPEGLPEFVAVFVGRVNLAEMCIRDS